MTTAIAPHRLWFGLLGAPGAWATQHFLGWFFGARICAGMSIASVREILGGIGIAALVCAAAGLLVGVRNLETARAAERAQEDRVEFMSLGGVLVSTAFVVGIAWAGLNAVFINVCGGMR
jgi:hypothetical protein